MSSARVCCLGRSAGSVLRMQFLKGHRIRHPVRVRSTVQLPPEFLSNLRESLERQSQQVVDDIGIPGLQVHQEVYTDHVQLIFDADCQLAKFARATMGTRRELIGAQVLELGCSTGLVGITAACCGAQVLLTDQTSNVPLATENVGLNSQLIKEAGGSIKVAALDWNNPDKQLLLRPWDFIFGSDLLYEEATVGPVAQMLATIMYDHPKARAKLSHIHRTKELDAYMLSTFAVADLQLIPVGQGSDEGPDITIYKVARSDQRD